MMDRKNNPKLVPFAKQLRKNMTKEEKHLWYDFLRIYPIKYDRQKILGKYIVDFYCASARLVVELDGSQHYNEEGKKYDEQRTAYLEKYQVRVVHISNREIKENFKGICDFIDRVTKERVGTDRLPCVKGAVTEGD